MNEHTVSGKPEKVPEDPEHEQGPKGGMGGRRLGPREVTSACRSCVGVYRGALPAQQPSEGSHIRGRKSSNKGLRQAHRQPWRQEGLSKVSPVEARGLGLSIPHQPVIPVQGATPLAEDNVQERQFSAGDSQGVEGMAALDGTA